MSVWDHAPLRKALECKFVPISDSKNTRRYAQIRGEFLRILCENYCTRTTQNHADALRNFAPLREKKICSCVLMSKKTHTEKHRILLRMLLRMSAPSAWDHNAPHGISVNSCPFVAQKHTRRYVKIRGDFSVYSVDCFPLTSSDSDFQFCVKFLTQRRKGRGAICSFVLLSNHCTQTDTEFTPLVYLFSVNNRLRRTPSCKATV